MTESLHQLLLSPHDTLFFRDSRPMGGSSTGHGDRFPPPHVINGALHAACHRAFADMPEIGYQHGFRDRNKERRPDPSERFGSLRTVGPFPVDENGRWFFPKPADLEDPAQKPVVQPIAEFPFPGESSLPDGLRPLARLAPPEKKVHPSWITKEGLEAILAGSKPETDAVRGDGGFFASEGAIGIGIDRETGTTGEGEFFSRVQLRLREGCRLGVLAGSGNQHAQEADLLERLFPEDGSILIGGEGRACRVETSPANPGEVLPRGAPGEGRLLKWVLFTPAIFPLLSGSAKGSAHPGGWLPTWVDPEAHQVLLSDGPGKNKARRLGVPEGRPIRARLVAARVEGSIPVTGWTNPGVSPADISKAGARSTLLAVPAGSVYYFEAKTDEDAIKLAAALNWYGNRDGTTIVNRRSTLLGEKGYGLGVCAPF